jgi:hypothetical protein
MIESPTPNPNECRFLDYRNANRQRHLHTPHTDFLISCNFAGVISLGKASGLRDCAASLTTPTRLACRSASALSADALIRQFIK